VADARRVPRVQVRGRRAVRLVAIPMLHAGCTDDPHQLPWGVDSGANAGGAASKRRGDHCLACVVLVEGDACSSPGDSSNVN
jgi:hypothetical protein